VILCNGLSLSILCNGLSLLILCNGLSLLILCNGLSARVGNVEFVSISGLGVKVKVCPRKSPIMIATIGTIAFMVRSR
jgi:hypothetical protein